MSGVHQELYCGELVALMDEGEDLVNIGLRHSEKICAKLGYLAGFSKRKNRQGAKGL